MLFRSDTITTVTVTVTVLVIARAEQKVSVANVKATVDITDAIEMRMLFQSSKIIFHAFCLFYRTINAVWLYFSSVFPVSRMI